MTAQVKPLIYALVDPRNGAVRYIGKTNGGPHSRPERHANPSGMRHNPGKVAWIQELQAAGLTYEVKPLSEPDLWDIDAAEQFAIAYFRHIGTDLLNRTDGGPGTTGHKKSPEDRAKQSARLKGVPKTKEHAHRLSESRKRMYRENPEAKARWRVAMEMAWKVCRKQIVDDLGNTYVSLASAAAAIGGTRSEVCSVLKGRRPTARGRKFFYLDKEGVTE